MYFYKDGIQFPFEFINAIENRTLIFFSGAGISLAAGLPRYSKVLDSFPLNDVEKNLRKEKKYENVFKSLEERMASDYVREIYCKVLTTSKQTQSEIHNTLLELTIMGSKKMITTNHDLLFMHALPRLQRSNPLNIHPNVPKNYSNWEGLVHIHGNIHVPGEMILSTEDFYKNYLDKHEIKNFFLEIAQKYTIAFIGYSLEDVCMQYILNSPAFKAINSKHYLFVSYNEGEEQHIIQRSKLNNLIPILHNKTKDPERKALPRDLKCLKTLLKQRYSSKKNPLLSFIRKNPEKNTDAQNSQVLWALKNKNGVFMKMVAEDKQLAPLSWIQLISQTLQSHSFLDFLTENVAGKYLDQNSNYLCCWLARHLENVELLFHIFNCKSFLHPECKEIFKRKLRCISLPTNIRITWELVLRNQFLPTEAHFKTQNIRRQILTAETSTEINATLKEIFLPFVKIRKRYDDKIESRLVLSQNPSYLLEIFTQDLGCKKALPYFLEIFCHILKETLEIMEKLNDEPILWYFIIPSIDTQDENLPPQDWNILASMVFKSWEETVKNNLTKGFLLLKLWLLKDSHPIFRRIALCCMKDENIDAKLALESLVLHQDLLWGKMYEREIFSLLSHLSIKLESKDFNSLKELIWLGPKGVKNKKNIQQEIFLRLNKFLPSSYNKTNSEQKLFNKFSFINEDQREGISFPIKPIKISTKKIPKNLSKLIYWLKENPTQDPFNPFDWKEQSKKNPSLLLDSLVELAKSNCWIIERWKSFLFSYAESDCLSIDIVDQIIEFLSSSPHYILNKLKCAISYFLKKIAKNKLNEDNFLKLVDIVVSLTEKEVIEYDNNNLLLLAHTDLVGEIIEALLIRSEIFTEKNFFLKAQRIFQNISNINNKRFLPGRIILASYLDMLLNWNKNWTEEFILPLFTWYNSILNARAVWIAYLYRTQSYCILNISSVKKEFLKLFLHYDEFSDTERDNLIIILAKIYVFKFDIFNKSEFDQIFSRLPQDSWPKFTREFTCQIQHALKKEFISDPWEKISIFLDHMQRDRVIIKKSSDDLANLFIVNEDIFIKSEKLTHLLHPMFCPSHTIYQLDKSGFCKKYPDQSLSFIDKIFNDNTKCESTCLNSCLTQIGKAKPILTNQSEYIFLKKIMHICS